MHWPSRYHLQEHILCPKMCLSCLPLIRKIHLRILHDVDTGAADKVSVVFAQTLDPCAKFALHTDPSGLSGLQ